MFSKITASGRRRRILSPTTIAASLGAHALLVGGALVASNGAPEPVRPAPEPHITWLEPEPPRRLPPAPAEPRLTPAELPRVPVPRGEAVVMPDPPREIPSELPEYSPADTPIDPSAVDGIGRPGAPDGDPDAPSAPGAPAGPSGGGGAGGVYELPMVEQRPSLRNAAEMQRVLQRTYPPLLREAGVTGQAQLQLVVDAEGRVEPGSVTVVSATHPGFEEPSLRAAERFRFNPARIGGRGVRVVITLPITWTLDRN